MNLVEKFILNLNGAFNLISKADNFIVRFSLIFCILLYAGFAIAAGSPSEDEVKAAFIYNFAKFVEWPDVGENKQLKVGYIGEKPLSGNLVLLASRKVNDRSIVVEATDNPSGWASCTVIFISDSEKEKLPEVLKAVEGKPVLTISDANGFASSGGIIGLMLVDNKVRFAINLIAANKAQLKISSQLLSLAKEVIR